jgi:hypothetical protein
MITTTTTIIIIIIIITKTWISSGSVSAGPFHCIPRPREVQRDGMTLSPETFSTLLARGLDICLPAMAGLFAPGGLEFEGWCVVVHASVCPREPVCANASAYAQRSAYTDGDSEACYVHCDARAEAGLQEECSHRNTGTATCGYHDEHSEWSAADWSNRADDIEPGDARAAGQSHAWSHGFESRQCMESRQRMVAVRMVSQQNQASTSSAELHACATQGDSQGTQDLVWISADRVRLARQDSDIVDFRRGGTLYMYVFMYLCLCVCRYVCRYVFMHVYVCIYIYT